MAEGVPTNNQSGRRSGPCSIWGGLDKVRHIVHTALLVRVRGKQNKNTHFSNIGRRPSSNKTFDDKLHEILLSFAMALMSWCAPTPLNKQDSLWTIHNGVFGAPNVCNGAPVDEITCITFYRTNTFIFCTFKAISVIGKLHGYETFINLNFV